MMPLSRNFKLILAYDGSEFWGWQVQVQARTVQGTLEDALAKILGGPHRVIAAGRTDAGVHALGQVVNVRTEAAIPADAFQRALQGCLPPDITVRAVEEVAYAFHARYLAQAKQYAYLIDTSHPRNPFLRRYVLPVDYRLDLSAMQRAADMFLGEHDFAAFMGVGSPVKTTSRRITRSEITTCVQRITYLIEGSGFLRHMVRNIVGTLLLVGRGALEPDDIAGIIAGRDRSQAGPTAPPQGLYLVGVRYEASCTALSDDDQRADANKDREGNMP